MRGVPARSTPQLDWTRASQSLEAAVNWRNISITPATATSQFESVGPGAARKFENRPLRADQLILNKILTWYENSLAEYPGGQIRAPFVLIFLNTYGLSC